MIVNDNDAVKRLNSPMNLINRLKDTTSSKSRNSAMSLFGVGRKPEEVKQETKQVESTEQKEVLSISFNPFKAKEILPSSETTPQEPSSPTPVLENILENHETQIKLGLAHDATLNLLNKSVELLTTKLDDIKADRLPLVVRAAGQVVTDIRKQQIANKETQKEKEVHYHFYTPQQKSVKDYEVIDVTST